MTQIERYFRTPEQARQEAREAYMRLCFYIDTQRSEDRPFVPAPTPTRDPKFTDAQKAMMYGRLKPEQRNAEERKNVATREAVLEILADGKPRTALELAAALGRPGNRQYARATAKRLLDKGLVELAKRRVEQYNKEINVYVLPVHKRGV